MPPSVFGYAFSTPKLQGTSRSAGPVASMAHAMSNTDIGYSMQLEPTMPSRPQAAFATTTGDCSSKAEANQKSTGTSASLKTGWLLGNQRFPCYVVISAQLPGGEGPPDSRHCGPGPQLGSPRMQ